jgi:hypothetical protein
MEFQELVAVRVVLVAAAAEVLFLVLAVMVEQVVFYYGIKE